MYVNPVVWLEAATPLSGGELTGCGLWKQGGEDGTQIATATPASATHADATTTTRFMMKIDISRSLTVDALRALLVDANGADQVEFTKTLKKDQTGLCWCGCGATTKGKFAPGHDSKFHSLAKQVARGQAEMPTEFVHDEAKADFMKHVEAERPLWAAKVAAVAAAKAAKPVKVAKTTKVEDDATESESEFEANLMAQLMS